MISLAKNIRWIMLSIGFSLVAGPVIAQDGADPDTDNGGENEVVVGFDSLRLEGGRGYVHTLAPWALYDSATVVQGYVYGMAAPSWIPQIASDDLFGGGYSRMGLSATKALSDFEFWANVEMSYGWRVTDETEVIRSTGDFAAGGKYAWNFSNAWTLTPFINIRMLSGISGESNYSDTLSPEFGAAIGWQGVDSARNSPFSWMGSVSFDYDRTFRLLSSATRQATPATPFERMTWRMSEYPFLKVNTAVDFWRAHCAWTLEMLARLPMVTDDTSLANGSYMAYASWRKPLTKGLMLKAFVGGGLPTNDLRTVPATAPYETGIQLSYGFGGLRGNGPVMSDKAEAVVEEMASEQVEEILEDNASAVTGSADAEMVTDTAAMDGANEVTGTSAGDADSVTEEAVEPTTATPEITDRSAAEAPAQSPSKSVEEPTESANNPRDFEDEAESSGVVNDAIDDVD